MDSDYPPCFRKKIGERRIDLYMGNPIFVTTHLLNLWGEGKGKILSEGDIRSLSIEENTTSEERLIDLNLNTSTGFYKKEGEYKIVFPYRHNGTELLPAMKTLLDNRLKNNVQTNDLWEQIEGEGVYARKIKSVHASDGWFFNNTTHNIPKEGYGYAMNYAQAKRSPHLLTILGHPDFVDTQFARPEGEIDKIISESFVLSEGKELFRHYFEHNDGLLYGTRSIQKLKYPRLEGREFACASGYINYQSFFAFERFETASSNSPLDFDFEDAPSNNVPWDNDMPSGTPNEPALSY